VRVPLGLPVTTRKATECLPTIINHNIVAAPVLLSRGIVTIHPKPTDDRLPKVGLERETTLETDIVLLHATAEGDIHLPHQTVEITDTETSETRIIATKTITELVIANPPLAPLSGTRGDHPPHRISSRS